MTKKRCLVWKWFDWYSKLCTNKHCWFIFLLKCSNKEDNYFFRPINDITMHFSIQFTPFPSIFSVTSHSFSLARWYGKFFALHFYKHNKHIFKLLISTNHLKNITYHNLLNKKFATVILSQFFIVIFKGGRMTFTNNFN